MAYNSSRALSQCSISLLAKILSRVGSGLEFAIELELFLFKLRRLSLCSGCDTSLEVIAEPFRWSGNDGFVNSNRSVGRRIGASGGTAERIRGVRRSVVNGLWGYGVAGSF